VCVCVCVCKCNVCECYSAVIVIRLTYTSTKTFIKNEWHDYGEYTYPLSISKLRKGYALSKCFSFGGCNHNINTYIPLHVILMLFLATFILIGKYNVATH